MKTAPFGWTGVAVPLVGQGTWHMGESRRRKDEEVAALRLGLELGLVHIDTAELYGQGGAEEVVAEAMRGFPRKEVFLVSKVLPQHASYQGTIRAAEASLRRLRTDYLDLYLLHWPGRYPIEETMGAMAELVRQGKIRFAGVSNFDVTELREAVERSPVRIACNQVLYNLTHRGIELDLLPFCRRHEIAVVGYTPFGGFPTRGVGFRVLEGIARRHGKTPRQVVLRFLTRLPGLFAIPKAAKLEHVRENAGASDFDLTEEDIREIDRVFPVPPRPVPLAMA
ncbi:MAG: aldo/keto reductase [Candidatus Binatia bacterium]|nr:MAG: aldo/keto reductase [Candidatus Binatia bacterium]